MAFDLYLIKGEPNVIFEHTALIGKLELPQDGGWLLVLARGADLGDDPELVFAPEIEEAREEMTAADSTLFVDGITPRILLHQLDDDLKTMKWVEMAVDLSASDV